MLLANVRNFSTDEGGAIAPLYALALFGIVGMAGVGFDYARVMALDTELQNAADQSALAAASQLDGGATAMDRAENAARTKFNSATSNYTNITRLSNVPDDDDKDPNSNPRLITGISFRFFDGYVNDQVGNEVTDPAKQGEAKVVEVTISNRKVRYALTPIVGAIAGRAGATAMAAVESAICKVPPLMICVPQTSGKEFPEDYIGVGVLMEPGAQVGAWTPGTFGYLDFGAGANTVKDLLGSNDGNDLCSASSGVDAQPGNIASAPDYLNTRFDIYKNSLSCDTASGDRCPAQNVRKDFVRKEVWEFNNPSSPPARPSCDKNLTAQNGGGIKVTVGDFEYQSGMGSEGFPRDGCHYLESCEKYGDADWGRESWLSTVGLTPPSDATTRYAIYKWERDNGSPVSKAVNSDANAYSTSGNKVTWTNYCSYTDPVRTPATSAKDRRLITVAAVDCNGKSGGKNFTINEWVDIFLVEPSELRGDKNTQQYQI